MDTPEYRKGLGNTIKKARKKTKLTQAQVAEKAGMSTNHYAMLERGEVNTTTVKLNKLEEILGINLLKL